MNTLIDEVPFICLDTETTGLSPLGGGRVCEIALLKSKSGMRLESFSTLINPQIYIEPEVTAIHGITNEMVAQSPSFADIAPRLLDMFEGSVLICHNADFDVSFLQNEFGLLGLKMPSITILDTLKFARRHGNFASNRLGEVARSLGISSEGWHRAMADTVMTEKIFYYFLCAFKARGARTVGDLFNLQGGPCCCARKL